MLRKKYLILLLSIIFVFSFSLIVLAVSENQAPELQEKVEAGEIEPLAERLPEEPYVVEPVESIGKYGGIANVNTFTATWFGDDTLMMSIWNSFIKPTPEGEFVPHFAKEIDISEDNTEFIIHMREGVKWSDGEPFTADDILFWYYDLELNEEYTPAVAQQWMAEGEPMQIGAVDDYTLKVTFVAPKPFFIESLAVQGGNWFQPKHYLKQFHPEYTDVEDLVEEKGFDEWYELLAHKAEASFQQSYNPDKPTLAAFKCVTAKSDVRIYERNPYFWKVDTEGNQLPYIDRIEADVVGDREVYAGRIMAGDVDFAALRTTIQDYPMFREYEERGNYRTILWESASNEAFYMVNQTVEDPVLREIFQDVRFRRALSLAIDRDEINEMLYFGRAKPRQHTVYEMSTYFEPEFAESYIEHDTETANALLNEMGLDEKDNTGYRLRPDGERLSFTISVLNVDTRVPITELVISHWKEVGIDVGFETVSNELQAQRAPANMLEAGIWTGYLPDTLFPMLLGGPIGTRWSRTKYPKWNMWFDSDGERGEEPPERIKNMREIRENLLKEPDEQKKIELAKELLSYRAQYLDTIGTVGHAPYPVIANNNLRNVPEDGIMDWGFQWGTNTDPEQMFFEE